MKKYTKGMSPKEMKDRRWLLDHNLEQVQKLIVQSGIQDAVGIVADMTGTYGRQLAMTRMAQTKGLTKEGAEEKVRQAIDYFKSENRFPTHIEVMTWGDAESFLPMTSPNAKQNFKNLKLVIEPGQHLVVAIGRTGNTYSIVELPNEVPKSEDSVREPQSKMKTMLKCANHNYAPGGIICVHLANGTSTNWCRVSSLGVFRNPLEVENDWLCPSCAAKWPNLQLEEVLSACIYCIRGLQTEGKKE